MTSALTWLNDLIQWLGRWVPRLVLIHPTHKGVRFGPRGRAKEVGPGVVFYWPMTHDLIKVPITTQSIQLNGQIMHIETGDTIVPKVAICLLNVQFSITDPVKASTKILNFMALVSNRGQAVAAQHWKGNMRGSEWIDPAKHQLQQEMLDYGISIHTLDIAGIGAGVVLKNVHDYGWNDDVSGRRPE